MESSRRVVFGGILNTSIRASKRHRHARNEGPFITLYIYTLQA